MQPAGERRAVRTRPALVVTALALAVVVQACTDGGDGPGAQGDAPEGCTTVEVASSPEKLDLLTRLATSFNRSRQARAGGACAFVRVRRKSSGAAATVLADGWRDEGAEGPRPVIWSPSASTWGAILNQRLAGKGQGPMAPADARPFMLTPLVIAMPKPMAEALGHPATPIGYADLI